MTIEEERQRIMDLWDRIEYKTKIDLANIWEERHALGELEARVERLEPKVIKLLEVIPSLQRHSHEYHARTVDLIKLIHHIESNDEWYQKVRSDVEYINEELKKIKIVVEERKEKAKVAPSVWVSSSNLPSVNAKSYYQFVEEVSTFMSSNTNVVTWINLWDTNRPLYQKLAKDYYSLRGVRVDASFNDTPLSRTLIELKDIIAKESVLLGKIGEKGFQTDPDNGEWRQIWDYKPASLTDKALLEDARKRSNLPIVYKLGIKY